ncbi:MAG TPA: glycosyltransferase [Candidatus Saccharimonadales bacterium]|nr:glycosyltransferase [Candidatus Saccharimonadales bacterium]
MKKPLLSVIIVVKNDRNIARTLQGIKENAFDRPYEVIVVDASEPAVLADTKQQHRWVRWEQYPVSDKRTTPQQRNRGLELAKGEIIVFIDANCKPVPGWLAAIAQTLESGEAIVCGPVNDLNSTNLVHYAVDQTKAGYVRECTTINVGLRRAVIDCIGNFDERFLFGQDVDFFWRTADAGYKIYFNPQMIIGHDWGDRKEQVRRAYKYGYARARLFKKHWRRHGRQLLHEPHVWMYSLFILGLPLTVFVPFYPLLVVVPLLKNRSSNPIGLVAHHLVFGLGVIVGACSSLS